MYDNWQALTEMDEKFLGVTEHIERMQRSNLQQMLLHESVGLWQLIRFTRAILHTHGKDIKKIKVSKEDVWVEPADYSVGLREQFYFVRYAVSNGLTWVVHEFNHMPSENISVPVMTLHRYNSKASEILFQKSGYTVDELTTFTYGNYI